MMGFEGLLSEALLSYESAAASADDPLGVLPISLRIAGSEERRQPAPFSRFEKIQMYPNQTIWKGA